MAICCGNENQGTLSILFLFLSDERYIAVSAGSGIYLYNTKGDLLWKDNYPSSIDSVIVSPKSNYILVGSGKVLYKQDINDDSNGNGESTNRLNNGRYVLNPNLINIQGNKSNSWWIILIQVIQMSLS